MPQTFNVGSRSRYVNATAWAFIVLAALAAASVWASPLTSAWWPSWLTRSSDLPWLTAQMVHHLPWVLAAATLLALALLGCATGLLLRLEWARRVFIALLAVVIAAQLGGLWLQHEVLSLLLSATLAFTALPAPAAGVVGGFAALAQAFAVLLTLAACALFGGVIRHLMSERVRQEFA